ncbi:hypothetical protein TorRG33x02_084070 [Trema orientale]|uniref:Uncharacterized protein n=1 Tax=Trema orientale TaxID=63057 RepID=A0A2P5FDN7_TREOI|nr:hypothetical protein TorRG33x02_084070 [Trema orientale]
MGNIGVFLNYNVVGGTIITNIYHMIETKNILVPNRATNVSLLEIMLDALELRPEHYAVEMKFVVNVRFSPVKIINDRDIKVYMELKKNEVDKTKNVIIYLCNNS